MMLQIVDFCCGSNDFSCLMKKKMDSVGKKCLFRNYDLFPAKVDFDFSSHNCIFDILFFWYLDQYSKLQT